VPAFLDEGPLMRRDQLLVLSVVFCVAGFLGLPLARPQGVYSYVDDEGVRVFTNIPPKNTSASLIANAGRKIQAQSLMQPQVGKSTSPALQNGFALHGEPSAKPALSSQFDPIIERYAPVYQLDPSLVRSMIATESAFNTRAVSRKGARGLMQLMPATAARLGVTDAFDAEDNIRGGMKHLGSLLDTFQDDLVLSLAAYNAGENLVQRIGRIPAYRETHDYVKLVTSRYGKRSMSRPPAAASSPAPKPAMFRFLDESGVLQLTNIPPVQHQALSASATGSAP